MISFVSLLPMFSFSHVVSSSGLSAGDGRQTYSLNPEEYVYAALIIYLDIIMIFLYILMIWVRLQKLKSHMHNLWHSQSAHAGWYSTFWTQIFLHHCYALSTGSLIMVLVSCCLYLFKMHFWYARFSFNFF